MRIGTLFRYLIGNRQAILEIASDRRALGIGFLFVLSAGFAREYDGKDLLHEPWHLFIPLGASLLNSFLLFLIPYTLLARKSKECLPFKAAYRTFLGLFWMTAPLAWLYAIPFDRFLTPEDATQANLWALAIVSTWRVCLMIRVLCVLMNFHAAQAVFLVLVFGDVAALLASSLLPFPIIEIMGGVRLSERQEMIVGTARSVFWLGSCSLPIWLVGVVIAAIASRPKWEAPDPNTNEPGAVGGRVHYLAWASLGVWVFLLPFTQPEQQLARRVERDLEGGRIAEGLQEMSAHSQEDFPPHWDPPPRMGYYGQKPPLVDIVSEMTHEVPAPWVRSIFLE
jgi:hypothetical protein